MWENNLTPVLWTLPYRMVICFLVLSILQEPFIAGTTLGRAPYFVILFVPWCRQKCSQVLLAAIPGGDTAALILIRLTAVINYSYMHFFFSSWIMKLKGHFGINSFIVSPCEASSSWCCCIQIIAFGKSQVEHKSLASFISIITIKCWLRAGQWGGRAARWDRGTSVLVWSWIHESHAVCICEHGAPSQGWPWAVPLGTNGTWVLSLGSHHAILLRLLL